MNRVIRACVEMGESNPIVSIHDQGAGGNGNVCKEIVEPLGAKLQAPPVPPPAPRPPSPPSARPSGCPFPLPAALESASPSLLHWARAAFARGT